MMSSRHTTRYPNTKGIISHRPPAMFTNYIHFSPTSFIPILQNINAMRQIYAFSPPPHFDFILLLFPGRFAAPPVFPFIFLCENPLPSALDCASLLLACLFLPPNPNFSFFFWRLKFPPAPPRRSGLSSERSSSTSKRSSSLVEVGSAPERSAWC